MKLTAALGLMWSAAAAASSPADMLKSRLRGQVHRAATHTSGGIHSTHTSTHVHAHTHPYKRQKAVSTTVRAASSAIVVPPTAYTVTLAVVGAADVWVSKGDEMTLEVSMHERSVEPVWMMYVSAEGLALARKYAGDADESSGVLSDVNLPSLFDDDLLWASYYGVRGAGTEVSSAYGVTTFCMAAINDGEGLYALIGSLGPDTTTAITTLSLNDRYVEKSHGGVLRGPTVYLYYANVQAPAGAQVMNFTSTFHLDASFPRSSDTEIQMVEGPLTPDSYASVVAITADGFSKLVAHWHGNVTYTQGGLATVTIPVGALMMESGAEDDDDFGWTEEVYVTGKGEQTVSGMPDEEGEGLLLLIENNLSSNDDMTVSGLKLDYTVMSDVSRRSPAAHAPGATQPHTPLSSRISTNNMMGVAGVVSVLALATYVYKPAGNKGMKQW